MLYGNGLAGASKTCSFSRTGKVQKVLRLSNFLATRLSLGCTLNYGEEEHGQVHKEDPFQKQALMVQMPGECTSTL